ncbi:alpha-ketoglutarate-dependent dioxygenase AlkB [bacterium]|nr:alpha-ketoglutarate-dependent dioxygenase AlkB [bacterium]
MAKYELADGGMLIYVKSFLSSKVAFEYFDEIKNYSSWAQRKGVFGHMQPRLTAAYGDTGISYTYSGTNNNALPWTSTLLEIKQKVERVLGCYNYCLLNRYRSGVDSVSMHSDNERGLGPIIATVSLGATRMFNIIHNSTKEKNSFQVSNGTLIIMAGTMQEFWKHEIPKTKKIVGERISLTFRYIS